MAKKITCDRKKDFFTPCYVSDGEKAIDNATGKCIGCGRTIEEIKAPKQSENTAEKVVESVELNQEQSIEMKKIHKELYRFFKAMEQAMLRGLVNGKTGWDTDLPIVLREKITETFNELIEGKNIEKESVDLANFCMMIWRKAKKA